MASHERYRWLERDDRTMRLTFWGTRGSTAVPGPDTLRYGGNTTCLELETASGRRVVIDAGSGIRALGLKLAQSDSGMVDLIITHLHWDHLLGFLFFEPLYRPGWKVQVGGWPAGFNGLKHIFDSDHGDGHFPVRWDSLPARVGQSAELAPPRFSLDGMEVKTIPLNHPQGGVGYRFREGGRTLVFLTDNELDGPAGPGIDDYARFAKGADVLIHDAQFTPQEHEIRQGWGHSDVDQALELARRAGVGRLVLFHHDPGRTDDQLDRLLAQAKDKAQGITVEAAAEGASLSL